MWPFRRPLEEILKLLPGTHTESKRVSDYLACHSIISLLLILIVYVPFLCISFSHFWYICYLTFVSHCYRMHLRTVHHLIYFQEVHTWTSMLCVTLILDYEINHIILVSIILTYSLPLKIFQSSRWEALSCSSCLCWRGNVCRDICTSLSQLSGTLSKW